ncbi:MAG: ribosome silencing factor [Rhodospirillales bacterium]|nr:ribosome silencing factor [Rhodospirillales bacterium]
MFEKESYPIVKYKSPAPAPEALLGAITASLDDDKAQDVNVIDLAGKTEFADYMVIATGTSQRHVATMAEHIRENLKSIGLVSVPVEGMGLCDWVLIDGGDVIVHLFKSEIRQFYELEKIWNSPTPSPERAVQPAGR